MEEDGVRPLIYNDGLTPQQRYRIRYPERYIAATRKWEKKNPEKVSKYNRTAYIKNRNERLEYQRRWYQENKDRQRKVIQERRKNRPAWFLYQSAKARAKKNGIPFSISESDIIVPSHCPVFGTPLYHGEKSFHDNSPSLDRVIPSLGYVPGNVVVISHRANAIKRDSTVTELKLLIKYMESKKQK